MHPFQGNHSLCALGESALDVPRGTENMPQPADCKFFEVTCLEIIIPSSWYVHCSWLASLKVCWVNDWINKWMGRWMSFTLKRLRNVRSLYKCRLIMPRFLWQGDRQVIYLQSFLSSILIINLTPSLDDFIFQINISWNCLLLSISTHIPK